jgi:hypothetical protein
MAQKTKSTGPLEAIKGSNALSGAGDMEVSDGDPAVVGYTKPGYPTAGPATATTQIKGVRSSVGSLGNDGTSRGSYNIQPDIVDAENPEPGDTGTGNKVASH